MLKVTAVSYLNTKPFLYGIFQSGLDADMELQLDIPSVCAEKLEDGDVDLGLVPVALIPQLKSASIISDFCIGCDGPVRTVCIYSDCPIGEAETLLLDYHSRTSVELAKILIREYWKSPVTLKTAEPGFIGEISGKTAALVIGDRAIGLERKHKYVYDLGEIWKKHTGLPFVFAAWVTRKPLEPEFILEFNRALRAGVASIPKLVYLLPSPRFNFSLEEYFQKYISYEFDENKKKALDLFLGKLAEGPEPNVRAGL